MPEAFAPYQPLAAFLLRAFDANGTDGSHDLSHIVRVWRNAARDRRHPNAAAIPNCCSRL